MGNKRRQLPRNSMSVEIQTSNSNEGSNNSNHFWRVTAWGQRNGFTLKIHQNSRVNSQSVDSSTLSMISWEESEGLFLIPAILCKADFFPTTPSVSGRHLRHGAETNPIGLPIWGSQTEKLATYRRPYRTKGSGDFFKQTGISSEPSEPTHLIRLIPSLDFTLDGTWWRPKNIVDLG